VYIPAVFVESVNLLSETSCDCCGALGTRLSVFVADDEGAQAAALAYCYPPHGDQPSEIWIDVVLGTWSSGDASDHVTFGCRYGPIDGKQANTCILTDAARFADEGDAILGHRLTREEALSHPWLADFWGVVDLVLTQVPEIGEHRARFHDLPSGDSH
jgi:hypothetical protein